MLVRSNFSFFDIYLSGVNLLIYLRNVVVRFILFYLKSANLLYRGTDISHNFRESLGLRDTESRL